MSAIGTKRPSRHVCYPVAIGGKADVAADVVQVGQQRRRSAADAGSDLQRADDRDRVRQSMAVKPSRHVEHGQAARPVACLHAHGGGAVSARAYGAAARGSR